MVRLCDVKWKIVNILTLNMYFQLKNRIRQIMECHHHRILCQFLHIVQPT